MDQKKLRIVFLSRYSGSVSRGVETYVEELSKRLSRFNSVEIFSGSESDDLGKVLRGKFDLVIPTNGRMQSLKVSLGRSFANYKSLISGQAGPGKDDIWNVFVTSPNVYVALTEFEKEYVGKWAWNSKLAKIPNGVDLDKFKPIGDKAKINLQPPIILSVGALEWYKHHELTIKALSKLDFGSLLIVGSGPQLEELNNLSKKLLGEERFKIVKANYPELPKYYRACDLFTLPSWDREAFGIVYVEAMASGLSVVGPDDSMRKEIIGSAGILVDVEDAEKFANAIREALNRKWGNLPRQQASKFSWDRVAEDYQKLFKKMFNL